VNDDVDIERALRDTLADRARRAPDAGPVIGRLLEETAARAAKTKAAPSHAGRWQTWTLPLAAAASIVALAVVIAAEITTSSHPIAVGTSGPVPTQTVGQPPTTGTPTSTVSDTIATVPQLTNVSVIDMTFVGPVAGWTLTSADCYSVPGRCTALANTTDGTIWHPARNPPVNVDGVKNCAAPCASGLRFANATVGYAFGPGVLAMTTDGAKTWQQQKVGAYALESLDDNVIRVVAAHSGCPGPCKLGVEYAGIGGTTWKGAALPAGPVDASSRALTRTSSDAYPSAFQGTAAQPQPAIIFVSTDAGHTWARLAQDPCAAISDSLTFVGRELTTAADGSVSVLCAGPGNDAIAFSTDHGAQFTAGKVFEVDGGSAGGLTAGSATTFLISGDKGVYRTVDGGQNWKLVIPDATSGSAVCGFQSSTDAHCTTNDRRLVYASHDGGLDWAPSTIG